MDAKKTILRYIRPNIVPYIIMLCIPPFFTIIGLLCLLCIYLPTSNRAKKKLERLEARGELNRAAEELMSVNAKRLVKGKAIFTDHYVFCKGNGYIFTYGEIAWVYKHRYTQRAFFIPIRVTGSLYLATRTLKPRAVASMGKDKMNEIKNAILEIYSHNKNCMIGYTKENAANYKMIAK